jgi:hypothetical protein
MTKKARLFKVQQILDKYQYQLGVNLSPEDLQEFTNQIGGDFYFYAVKCMEHPTYKNQKRFINVQFEKDGEWRTFSWNGAIKGTRGEGSETSLTMAMRMSIQHQIYAYANKIEMVCAVCSSDQFPQVDHVNKSFKFISDLFLEEHGRPELVNLNDGMGWRIKDPTMDEQWNEFHKRYATYRVLCRPHNASFGANSNA